MWLKCFRGFQTVTALGIAAELHGFRRFLTPRDLMGCLGLVPSESTSSDSRKQGSITKTGNCHVRKLLVEAAWHYLRPWTVSGPLKKRRDGQPAHIMAIADKAGLRPHRKFCRLTSRGKLGPQAVIAVARELAGSRIPLDAGSLHIRNLGEQHPPAPKMATGNRNPEEMHPSCRPLRRAEH